MKAVLCKTWLEEGACAGQGQGCQFAHGQKELGAQTGITRDLVDNSRFHYKIQSEEDKGYKGANVNRKCNSINGSALENYTLLNLEVCKEPIT